MQHSAEENDLMVYGYHPVLEAIKQGRPIHKVILPTGDFTEHAKKIWFDLKGTDVLIQRWPLQKIDKVAKGNHQGILAYISPVAFDSLDKLVARVQENGEVPAICWLDGVSDVRNLGAIMRSAACFGMHGIILPAKSGATLTADVIKSSAGAIYHIPLILSKSTPATLSDLANLGVFVVAVSEKAENTIEDVEMENPTCLVLGDEGRGVSREIIEFADGHFKIPMKGDVASLNVSVAAGVTFYEWFKKSSK